MIVLAPAVLDVSVQLQFHLPATGLSQSSVGSPQVSVPSLTVTPPVGVPPPGATTSTVPLTVYGSPTTVPAVKSVVITTVVSAFSTVCGCVLLLAW